MGFRKPGMGIRGCEIGVRGPRMGVKGPGMELRLNQRAWDASKRTLGGGQWDLG